MTAITLGWIGSICFACCGIPQAWQAHRTKSTSDLSWSFLLLWFFGELLTIQYIWPKQDYPLLLNYSINFCCLLVIIYYKIQESLR